MKWDLWTLGSGQLCFNSAASQNEPTTENKHLHNQREYFVEVFFNMTILDVMFLEKNSSVIGNRLVLFEKKLVIGVVKNAKQVVAEEREQIQTGLLLNAWGQRDELRRGKAPFISPEGAYVMPATRTPLDHCPRRLILSLGSARVA